MILRKKNYLKIQMKTQALNKIFFFNDPDIYHNLPTLTMSSGLMTVHNNDPDNFIDDPEYFHQYPSWIISGHGGNTLQKNTNQVSTAQLDGGSKSHVFANITMFTYIRPEKWNVQILNGRKSPTKSFGLVIVKIPKIDIIILLWPSYYIP